MQTEEMILVEEFCMHHQIEISFVQSLKRSGLIEVLQTGEKLCVPRDQLPELEKMARLYYEMDINMEGIETISYLLSRIHDMQQEIIQLQNRLQLYEEGEDDE